MRERHAPQDGAVAKLQPLATALFASSPFTEGKPNGLLSWRGDIWRDTDNNRSGLLDCAFEPGFGFEQYVEWALDVPMYFIIRDGRYRDCTNITFRQFMAGALKGEVEEWQPTMGDWTNHLSTLFPDVRLKRFLEMRGADGGTWRRICALPSFWVGLLYETGAMDAAEQLTSDWTIADIHRLREEVPRLALKAEIGGRSLLDVGRDVIEIARMGLKARQNLNSSGQSEAVFLMTLDEIVAKKATFAEDLLALYNGRWKGSVDPLFSEFQY
nr:glutamate-cysteine ligase family protein [Marinicella sp. W31]MDC2876289.1 glutamate-cysteine ligase family protein [Marinicella sp. W31]